MLATMDKKQDNSQAKNIYSEHLQPITLMNRPKEMVPLSSGLQTSKPVNVVEMMLLSSAALFTPVTWFLEFLVRLTRKETKKRRSFPGSVCYQKACGAQQPSPTASLTDIFVDSLKERVQVIRKKRSSGSLPQLRSESVLSIPLTNTSYKTSPVTSVCSVFNWRNKTVLTSGGPSIREVLQKRLQDVLHDASVYVKMRAASKSRQSISKTDSQTVDVSSTSSATWSQRLNFWSKPSQSRQSISKTDSQTVDLSSSSSATWSQRLNFWSKPVEPVAHVDLKASLPTGSLTSNFGKETVQVAENLDCTTILAAEVQTANFGMKASENLDHKTSLATISQTSNFGKKPVKSVGNLDCKTSLATGSKASNFGKKAAESAENLDHKSGLATMSQTSHFSEKPAESDHKTSLATESQASHDSDDHKIKCALCKGRKFIRKSSKKTLDTKTSDLIRSVAKQSVDMVIRAVKAGDILKEGTKRVKGSLADKVLKVLERAGITPDDSQSSTTCILRKKPEQNGTRRSKSDSNLFNLFRTPKKPANIPGCNSDISAAVQGETKSTLTSSSSSSITLASDLTSTISSYVHQSMNNLMGVLSSEIQGKPGKMDHSQATSKSSGTTMSCSEATPPDSKTELPKNKEALNSAATSTLNAAIENNSSTVNSAVMDCIKSFANATADQVLDAILKAMTKPFVTGSHFIPDKVGQQNLVQQVFLLIRHHHDLIELISEELFLQAYAQQYANTVVANTIAKARYELKQGSWVFKQKDEIAKKLKRGAKEAIQRMFVATTKNKAKLKKILSSKQFQTKMINAVMCTALRKLEEQTEKEDKFKHSCCCDLVNKVNMLYMEDDKALTDTNMLHSITDNLLRNLTYEAAEHLGEDMSSLMFDIADFDTVAHIAVKGSTVCGLAIEPCLQAMAQVLVQIDEDLDVSIDE